MPFSSALTDTEPIATPTEKITRNRLATSLPAWSTFFTSGGKITIITDAIDGLQRDVSSFLHNNWQATAWVLGGIVAAAIGYSVVRERARRPQPE